MQRETSYKEDIIMSLQNRIDSLKVRHAMIKYELNAQYKISCWNDIELSALKKQKLAIKDELERIKIN